MSRKLKIVKLLEPEICMDCRFAQMADVENESGQTQRMLHCKRLDCDNWDYTTLQPAKKMQVDEDWAA